VLEALVHLVRLIHLLAELGDLMHVFNALIQTVLDVTQIGEDFDRLFVCHQHLAHPTKGRDINTFAHRERERERERGGGGGRQGGWEEEKR